MFHDYRCIQVPQNAIPTYDTLTAAGISGPDDHSDSDSSISAPPYSPITAYTSSEQDSDESAVESCDSEQEEAVGGDEPCDLTGQSSCTLL